MKKYLTIRVFNNGKFAEGYDIVITDINTGKVTFSGKSPEEVVNDYNKKGYFVSAIGGEKGHIYILTKEIE